MCIKRSITQVLTFLFLGCLFSACGSKIKTISESDFESCSYWPSQGELQLFEKCLYSNQRSEDYITPQHYKNIVQDEHKLRSVFHPKKGWAYVTKDRKLIYVPTFDNGPDPLKEGMFRFYDQNKKLGFMDKNFKAIILPKEWVWVFPFSGGRAIYCEQCESVKIDEHHVFKKGFWGEIDAQGNTISPKVPYEQWNKDRINQYQEKKGDNNE